MSQLCLVRAGSSSQGIAATQDWKFASNKSLVSNKGLSPSFTRASGGSYFDASGVLRWNALNLFNRSEEMNLNFSKDGCTVSSNVATAPDGTVTADKIVENSGTTSATLFTTTASGKILSVYAKKAERDFLYIGINNPTTRGCYFNLSNGTVGSAAADSVGQIESVGNGWYRCSLKVTVAGTVPFIACAPVDSGSGVRPSYTGDGLSGVFLWGAMFEDSSYLSPYAATNGSSNAAPRFDHVYNPSTNMWESRGLLIEEQRTNSWTNSADCVGTPLSGGSPAAGAYATDPTGGSLARVFTAPATTGPAGQFQSITNAGAFSISVFAKAGTYSFLALDGSNTGNKGAVFNLANGTVGYVDAGITATITKAANGFWRCSISGSSSSFPEWYFSGSGTANVRSATWAGTETLTLFGMQVETGAFSTSYIPTTSASVTRSADVCQVTGASFSGFWNATEGSFAVEADRYVESSTDPTCFVFSANNGTVNNAVNHYFEVAGGIAYDRFTLVNAGAATAILQRNAGLKNTAYRCSGRYKTDDASASYNGGACLTDNLTAVPSISQLDIGNRISAGFLNGHISRLRYFNRALTDKQLEDLGKPELSKSLDLQFASTKSLTPLVGPTPSYSRASAGWYFNSSGVLTQAAIDEPRFDHTYNGSTWVSRGLLIEEQRTNLCLWSGDMTQTGWVRQGGITVTGNADAWVDGTVTAQRMNYPAGSGHKSIYRSFTATAAAHTVSLYAKAGTVNWLGLGFGGGAASSDGVYFNLTNGTIGNSAAGSVGSIVSCGNGWYRCSVTRTLSAGTSYIQWSAGATNGHDTGYISSGTETVLFGGAQIELGSAPSSYIPTTSASVTRSADVCQITGTNFSSIWNASEGTIVCKFTRPTGSPLTAAPYSYYGSNESTDVIYLPNLAGNESAQVWVGNVSQATLNTGASPAGGTARKVSFGFRANDFAASKDGAAVASDASGSITTCTQMKVGYYQSTYVNGWIELLQHYTIRLPNRLLIQKSS